MEKLNIIKIMEPDFGCEGLPDGQELTDKVYVEAPDGSRRIIAIEDKLLYDLDLDEGDSFCLMDDGTIKPL